MKLVVGVGTRSLVVDSRLDALRRTAQALNAGRHRSFAGQANGLALDGDARFQNIIHHLGALGEREGEEVAEHRGVRPANDGAGAVQDLDDTDHGQGAHGLAQHGAGDAESEAQLALRRQATAGLGRIRQELPTQSAECLPHLESQP